MALHFNPQKKRGKIDDLNVERMHGIKGFVIPTKLFFKIGITKIFCYNNKMFSSINNRLVAAAKFLFAGTKNSFVVPNFVDVTEPFFSESPRVYHLVCSTGVARSSEPLHKAHNLT